jgi:hypothetical protein
LAASDVSEELVGQQSRDELALVGDSRGEDRAIEDVVLQQRSQQSFVGSQRSKGRVVNLGECFIRGRKDSNILRAIETLDQRTETGRTPLKLLSSLEEFKAWARDGAVPFD